MIHLLEHVLGVCGDKHISILGAFLEIPNVNLIFMYVKILIKQHD